MKGKGRYQKESRKLYRNNQQKKKKIRERLEKEVEEGNLKSMAAVPNVEEEIKIRQEPPCFSDTISQEDLEELMNCIKKEDPYLKPIIEDIEIGGPIVMTKYLNDPEVLYKLGKAMGFVEDKEPPHHWC